MSNETHDLWGPTRRAQPLIDLRRLMRQQGITNAELARRMGVSEVAASRVLRRDNVQIDTLYRIADALGIGMKIEFFEVTE